MEDPELIDRIRALAIPPAWKDVWICPYPMGHIQATGMDAAGRKQYRYHDRWREAARPREVRGDGRVRQGAARRCARAWRRTSPRTRSPASESSPAPITDARPGFFRIGSEDYAEENESLRAGDHPQGPRDLARTARSAFVYDAKGGRRSQQIADPEVVDVIRELKRRRGGGDELLAYKRGAAGST